MHTTDSFANDTSSSETRDSNLVRYLNLKLGALGERESSHAADASFLEVAAPLLRNHFQKDEALGWPLCPVDARIQAFLDSYLSGSDPSGVPRLPSKTLVLDRSGLARVLALPPDSDRFASAYLTSYRIAQGVLHNPKSDRRTTKGVFHVAAGGLPVPVDKQEVPKLTFSRVLAAALRPPADALVVPFTASEEHAAHLFVSLLQRPIICPATPREPEKRMDLGRGPHPSSKPRPLPPET